MMDPSHNFKEYRRAVDHRVQVSCSNLLSLEYSPPPPLDGACDPVLQLGCQGHLLYKRSHENIVCAILQLPLD
jgi:hypothetical protein